MSVLSKFIQGVRLLGFDVTMQAAFYPLRKRFNEARFAHPGLTAPLRGLKALVSPTQPADKTSITYTFPGRVLGHRWNSAAQGIERQTVELTCENALIRLTFLTADLVRVRVSPDGRFGEPFSYAVCKADNTWPPIELSLEETANTLTIRTPKLTCRIEKQHFALTFIDLKNNIIHADAAGCGWSDHHIACWTHLPPTAHVYGLGQKTTRLDKRGLAFSLWNTDPQFYHPGDDPLYSNIPFYLGLNEGHGYGIFWDTPVRARIDFGALTPGITHFEAEVAPPAGRELRYYFFYGPRLSDVLDRYTELTGRMIMPPLWALGYHQNRWSYSPDRRVREIAAEFRTRRIPCEAIHLDIEYMDGFRCFTWHPERFPSPAALIADLHTQGFKVVAMIDPGIKVDSNYWVCLDGLENDVFCKYPNGALFHGPVWPGDCYFPDFTSPRVRKWWGHLYTGLVDLGIDGFWNDMNEPAVMGHRGDTFPDVVQHHYDGHGADHRTAHNLYGMQMARASAEGLMEHRPDERPLVISRSVWAGSQRYNMHWLGDNHSDWPSLRNTMQLVLNMGLSGIAFTGPDTGGFAGNCNAELLIRWNQMSVFMPFFRNHTAKGTADQEPWAFGPQCEQISREMIELRYRLLPYHYTAFWQCAQHGLPMARPLFLPFQDDPHTCQIDDQFMFGDALLVSPIYEPGARSRRAYIPAGCWYDFWTNTLTAGPQITQLDAPLERIPLLVRAGSVIPMWPLMQYSDERPVDVLTLHTYPGTGESWLYEDDGHTWAFREGAYRLTRFLCALDGSPTAPRTFKLRREVTPPRGPLGGLPDYTRLCVELHGFAHPPAHIRIDGTETKEWEFTTETRTVHLESALFKEIEAIFE